MFLVMFKHIPFTIYSCSEKYNTVFLNTTISQDCMKLQNRLRYGSSNEMPVYRCKIVIYRCTKFRFTVAQYFDLPCTKFRFTVSRNCVLPSRKIFVDRCTKFRFTVAQDFDLPLHEISIYRRAIF